MRILIVCCLLLHCISLLLFLLQGPILSSIKCFFIFFWVESKKNCCSVALKVRAIVKNKCSWLKPVRRGISHTNYRQPCPSASNQSSCAEVFMQHCVPFRDEFHLVNKHATSTTWDFSNQFHSDFQKPPATTQNHLLIFSPKQPAIARQSPAVCGLVWVGGGGWANWAACATAWCNTLETFLSFHSKAFTWQYV